MLTQTELRDHLTYDPETGLFRWHRSGGNHKAGAVAGCEVQRGRTRYIQIRVMGKLYYAHQLAWLYVTGEWPPRIDHKNRNGLLNAWENLRTATQAQNVRNKTVKVGKILPKGVHRARSGRFYAQIVLARKTHHLGTFSTAEEAYAAYKEAAERLHGGFNTG